MAIVDSFDEVDTLQLYLCVIDAGAVQLFVPYLLSGIVPMYHVQNTII